MSDTIDAAAQEAKLESSTPDVEQPKARKVSKKHVFCNSDLDVINVKYPKFFKDILIYHNGSFEADLFTNKAQTKTKTIKITELDVNNPLAGKPLQPGYDSPICQKCGLCTAGESKNPFLKAKGSETPLVTVIFDSVSRSEDVAGEIDLAEAPSRFASVAYELSESLGIKKEDFRWVPLTRCYAGMHANLKVKGNWCRYHLVDDLMRHPPKFIIPVGTTVLGLMCHKSSAQDWQGKVLTWRGWPDDWLTNAMYALPTPDPLDPTKEVTQHPLFGKIPSTRIPMMPIQTWGIIKATKNNQLALRWKKTIKVALSLAVKGVKANVYTREWYHFTEDVEEIKSKLQWIINNKGIELCYDTETTGLKPWAPDAAVVCMMLRWIDPTGTPDTLGFPWDTDVSSVREHINELSPLIRKALIGSKLTGHNLTFDLLYTYAVMNKDIMKGWDDKQLNLLRDNRLCKLADASDFDTWHAAFALEQKPGTLGLEALAYTHAKGIAGYEEDMVLLIELLADKLDPAAGKGGHYMNCPRDKWDSHLIPYVMGDVESASLIRESIEAKLQGTSGYSVPYADVTHRGRFTTRSTPDRNFVYNKIMLPASAMLIKIMGRGMFINEHVLETLEQLMPTKIVDLRKKLQGADPRIEQWIAAKEAETEGFELDLENKEQLKDILYKVLEFPVQKITKAGKKIYGEKPEEWDDAMVKQIRFNNPDASVADIQEKMNALKFEYAATDKFTLNHLAVDFPGIRPLQDYRKVFKLYSTYVRPMRNYFAEGVDKKERIQGQHLMYDSCIHAGFLLTGTRGGRLSSRSPNLQQLPRDGEVKQMFTSRFGSRGCIYTADLSQIELRLMASMCGDPTMVHAYNENLDIHSLTTSRIFNVPYEHFSKDYMKFLQKNNKDAEAKDLDLKRGIGKTTNFLTGYGGGAYGLQNVLANRGIYKSIEFCQGIIDAFFDAYPSLKKFLGHYKWFIQEHGVAVSVFGRVRIFEEMQSEDDEAKAKALRAGCNHAIQSTASDMMLLALIAVEAMMREAGNESMLVSTVHDSLVIDTVRGELDSVHDTCMTVLNNFPAVLKSLLGDNFDTSFLLVPITGDAEVGLDYYSLRKVGADASIDWDQLLVENH